MGISIPLRGPPSPPPFHLLSFSPPPPVPVLYTAYKGTTSAAGIRRRRPALLSGSPPRLSLSAELRGYFYTVKRLELASFHCPRLELPFSVCTYIDAPTCARAPTRHRPAHGSEDSPLLYRLITNGRWTLSTIYERESREGRGRWGNATVGMGAGEGELSRKGNRSPLVINADDWFYVRRSGGIAWWSINGLILSVDDREDTIGDKVRDL